MNRLSSTLLIAIIVLATAATCSSAGDSAVTEPSTEELASTPAGVAATNTISATSTSVPAQPDASATATPETPSTPSAAATVESGSPAEPQPAQDATVPPLPQPAPEATATPWIPVRELPADQLLGLPDVDASYDIHITEINVDSGFVQAEQVVSIPEFRDGRPAQLFFQVVPAAYGFFSMDQITVNGQSIEQVTINNGFTYVVPVDPTGTGGLEIGMQFHLSVGFEASGWGYTSLDSGILRLGYWAPLISTDHPNSETFDPSFTRVATFDVTLDIEPGIDFAHSGEITGREDLADGRVRYLMHGEQIRDFDLILSRSYLRKSGYSQSGVLIEYYWSTAVSSDNADYIISVAADALDQMTALLGPYPYPTLRIADAGPSMPGGIEFANLIYINPVYNPLNRLIYHEVAHEWLYGIIGNRTMRDGWIDEGGAEFFERGMPTGFTEIPPVPAGGFQFPLDLTVYELGHSDPGFYYAVYEQGARLYYAVLEAMGWDAFWAAMRSLYDQFRFGVVTAWDLLYLWQSNSGVDLRPLFDSYFRYPWIYDLPDPGVTTHQGWLSPTT